MQLILEQHRFELHRSTHFFSRYGQPSISLGFYICGFSQLQMKNYFHSVVGNLGIRRVNLSYMGAFNSTLLVPLTTTLRHSRVNCIL